MRRLSMLIARMITIMIALALALAPSLCRAQLPPGGRAQAMGAYTALADDIYGVYYNPAGAARFGGLRGSIGDFESRLTGPYNIFDLINHFPNGTQGQIDFARHFSGGVSNLEISSDFGVGFKNFAISVLPFATGQVVPYKNVARTQIGFDFVNVGGQQVPVAGSNAVLTGTYGYQVIGTFAHNVGNRLSVGVNLKLIDYLPTVVTVGFNGSANGGTTTTTSMTPTTTFGADIGALYTVLPGLTVGSTLRNVIQPVGGYPTVLTSGVAYRIPNTRAVVAADLANIGHTTTLNLGSELRVANAVALRAGINSGRPTVGVGVGPFSLSYALNQTHVGFSLGF